MRLLALCCQALERRFCAAVRGSPHTVTVRVNEQGLHTQPARLRDVLQQAIDAVEPGRFDAVVLVYGVCGAAVQGLVARDVPVVIARAHDCITLYLGSRHRYQRLHDAHPGTYWYIQDYTEAHPATDPLTPGGAENQYQQYVAQYGEDNAAYLMSVLGDWNAHYNRAIVIDTGRADAARYAAAVRTRATERGWTCHQEQGDNRLLERLASADWDDADFLVLHPGQRLDLSYDSTILQG